MINDKLQTILGDDAVQHWYAVYVRPSHEAQVAKRFAIRGIEGYLPRYQVEHRWKNRCSKKLDLPLFPGYIFAHVFPSERVRVLEVPSVLFLVGNGNRPTALSESEIDVLRTGLAARNALPHPFLRVGERARIRRGPLAGMEGFVLREKNSLRVVISLELIMRSVVVEVDRDELEPVESMVDHAPTSLGRTRSPLAGTSFLSAC